MKIRAPKKRGLAEVVKEPIPPSTREILTIADLVRSWNEWAEANGKLNRIIETPGGTSPYEWIEKDL